MRALVSVVSLFFLGIQAHSEWSYSGDDGVAEDKWPEKYPSCGGERQSPIDVQNRKVLFNSSLTPLRLVNYDEYQDLSMTNNGHTVQITLPHTMRLIDSDGTVFIAEQMHSHWGGGNSEISGSEHTIDGIRSMMEIHIVHFNKKYKSYENAKDQKDGLAVLAVLVEVDEYKENTYYNPIISKLNQVKYPGQNTTLKNINIRNLLPENIIQYFTYLGSLTTPPCTENVKWFVFRNYVTLSKVQAMTIENTVVDYNNQTIHNDYRTTQPLNDRTVESNFQYSSDACCKYPTYIKKQQESIPHHWKLKKIKKIHHY